MAASDWRPIGKHDPAMLGKARLHAHYAVQWLARAARAYVAPQADDSHTNLGWDDALDGFTTHALKDGARLGLRISDLTLVMLDAQRADFPLNGRTDADARTWLGAQLSARGMDAVALDAPSPYAIDPDPIAGGAAYDVSNEKAALRELAAWFSNADRSLSLIRSQMTGRKHVASPVRCWPHHFDLATLVSLDEAGGETARSVNAGFSPGDEHYQEPYFYVSPYPYPDAAALPQPHALGHWHTRHFTAAIAPAKRIVAATHSQHDVEAFLAHAIEGSIKLLN